MSPTAGDTCGDFDGDDPISLANRGAVTEPFTDFSAEAIMKLAITRIYQSADVSVRASGGIPSFGRGWRHGWESSLVCRTWTMYVGGWPDLVTQCKVLGGSSPGMMFRGTALTTADAFPPYAGETWQLLVRSDDEALAGDRSILARRPNGEYIAFLTDGRQLHFGPMCDRDLCGGGADYCPDSQQDGRMRLVKVVDASGNAVTVSYDRPAGIILSLTDDLGHNLKLRSSGNACSDGRVRTLEYDGAVYATYDYGGDGGDLVGVRQGGSDAPLVRSYEYVPGRPGYLAKVRNESGDPIAEFGYDANGYATSLKDRLTTLNVSYESTTELMVSKAYAVGGSVSSRQSRGIGGRAANHWQYRRLLWIARYLRCTEDAESRVHYYERDQAGRILWHAVFAPGTYTCQNDPPPPELAPQSEEWFEYGLQKPVAEGWTVGLTTVTKHTRRSILADRVANTSEQDTFDRVYDYDQIPKSGDPSGYSCAESPMPVGSVLCRYVEDGLTLEMSGNVIREQHATYFSYDSRGRLTKSIGPLVVGRAVTDVGIPVEERIHWPDVGESLPRLGRVREVKRYPGGGAPPHVITFDYDVFGPFHVTDPNGRTTLLVRDARGRVIAMTTPDQRAVTIRYYDERWPRLVFLNGGSARWFRYDDKGRVRTIQPVSGDPEVPGANVVVGWMETVGYDPAGNPTTVTQADDAGVVRFEQIAQYDADHRLTNRFHPHDQTKVATWQYDLAGVLKSISDEEGKNTEFVPDEMGRPRIVRRTGLDTEGVPISLDVATYDYEGGEHAMRSVTDGEGRTTTYDNDDFGRVLSVGSQLTMKATPWRYQYDARGNVTMRTGGQVTTTYAYDGLRRLTGLAARNAYDGEEIAYTYEYDGPGGIGRLWKIAESDRTTEFTYDAVGRLESETVRENGIETPLLTVYQYDADGDLEFLNYPSGLTLQYERDPVTKEVIAIRNVGAGTQYASGITYFPQGPVKELTFGNGTTLSQSFNLRYEPTSIASGPLHLTYTPTWGGNIGSVVEADVTTIYGHDFLDRLTSFEPGRNPEQGPSLRYGYNGDRLIEAFTDSSSPQRRYAYGYDDRTNVSAISVYDGTGTITATVCLKHDALGRLVLVGHTAPGNGGPDVLACRRESDVTAVIARFKYDARNRRVAEYRAETGVWTHFAFTPDSLHLAELARPASASDPWVRQREYVWLRGLPIAQLEHPGLAGSGTPYAYYFHVDHIGLPRALTNATGVAVWVAAGRPYGDIVESAIADPVSGRTVVTNLRLPGQYDERLFAAAGISGLQGPYYNWNRWYLPSVGRYLELDPIAVWGGFNDTFGPDWYNYAEQNPLQWTDSTGLTIWKVAYRIGQKGLRYGRDLTRREAFWRLMHGKNLATDSTKALRKLGKDVSLAKGGPGKCVVEPGPSGMPHGHASKNDTGTNRFPGHIFYDPKLAIPWYIEIFDDNGDGIFDEWDAVEVLNPFPLPLRPQDPEGA